MPHGTVKRIEPALGFGWIVDDAGMDWFFIRDGVRGGEIEAFAPKERVTFSYEWTPTGPRAIDVTLEYPRQAH